MLSVICQSYIICSVSSRCNANWDPFCSTKRDNKNKCSRPFWPHSNICKIINCVFSLICQSHIICSVPSRCNTNWDSCWGTKRYQQKYYKNSNRSWKFWWKILQMFTQFFEFLVGNIVKHCVSWNFWWEISHKKSCVSWIRWWEIIQTNSSLSWNFLVETITKVRIFLDISGETYYKSSHIFNISGGNI